MNNYQHIHINVNVHQLINTMKIPTYNQATMNLLSIEALKRYVYISVTREFTFNASYHDIYTVANSIGIAYLFSKEIG